MTNGQPVIDVRTPLKVIHSCPTIAVSGGGPPRSITQLCSHLSKLDIDVSIHVFESAQEEVLPDSQVDIIRSKDGDVSNLRMVTSRGAAATIIHQHGIWLPSAHKVSKVASELDRPLILSPRGMMEGWSMKSKRWKKLLAWWLYQRRDCHAVRAYHATSLMEAESIRRLGLKQPIIVLPNGVSMAPEAPLDPAACNLLRDKKTAFFLSRVNPKKGLPLLLEAWAKIRPPDWELVIAGNDDANHQPELESISRKLGLEESVKFLGPLFGADKDSAYRNADLFILPTYSENFGIVVAEALSYEIPVITTNGTPWEELISDDCGWWVEPTVEGIHSALQHAFSCSADQLNAMGARGKYLVEQQYAWDSIASNMRLAYQWLLGRASQPEFVIND